jgi:hypothetical protein
MDKGRSSTITIANDMFKNNRRLQHSGDFIGNGIKIGPDIPYYLYPGSAVMTKFSRKDSGPWSGSTGMQTWII